MPDQASLTPDNRRIALLCIALITVLTAMIYAQVIDDKEGKTIASASSLDKGAKNKNAATSEGAAEVGKRVAEAAKKAGVTNVVFDRGGFLFHGRVKALADAAREGGLEF